MPKFNVFLLNEYRNAYVLTAKKNYSEPKIYDANGDIARRWYVYFSFRNPKTVRGIIICSIGNAVAVIFFFRSGTFAFLSNILPLSIAICHCEERSNLIMIVFSNARISIAIGASWSFFIFYHK
jgi:hypothetical protein